MITQPASADELRAAMVDKLLTWGGIRTPQVEAAMRAVPRHLFVPDADLTDAYGPESVVTFRDDAGIAISSASGPGVVSTMLEQLDVQPGHRVLEIGAGTGYNAALLAELVGPDGHVTTIDIGEDIVDHAARCLSSAGYDRVHVVLGDGAEGVPADAPYDRIIVTAGAWDVPTAWRDQLAPGGRLVVPLRMRGVTRAVGLELDDDGVWHSVNITECGFMPMRGDGETVTNEVNVELPGTHGVRVRTDDGQPVDVDALAAALDLKPSIAWSGVIVPLKPFDHLDFWLAGAQGADLCRVVVTQGALANGLVAPIYPWGSMGCYTDGALAYLVRRDSEDGTTTELGACAYGADSEKLAEAVVDRLAAWGQARESMSDVRVEVHPLGSPDRPALITADKAHSRVFVIVG